jgi:tRNA threonylcarbamoyladenosine biosynthesis protein TsaE
LRFPSKRKSLSVADTSAIAVEFSKVLDKFNRIVLLGELGAGKTFFIKEVLKQFEIYDVNSPTFAIVNQYEGKIKAFHFDFYRLKNFEELLEIGWLDYLNDEDSVMFIEWGDLVPQAVPEKRIEIKINVLEDLSREFEFVKYGK